MKKMKKRLLAMGVCLAVLFCSLAPVQVADAASKTINLTVRYKGKNVTFESYRNLNTSKAKCTLKAKTYASVKKMWGKANEIEKYGNEIVYTWKNGKTRISFITNKKGKRKGNILIDIQNKKATVFNIKVGMSKKQALQKLRKQFGTKNVVTNPVDPITGKKITNLINVKMKGVASPMEITLKSGKVKSIYFWHS